MEYNLAIIEGQGRVTLAEMNKDGQNYQTKEVDLEEVRTAKINGVIYNSEIDFEQEENKPLFEKLDRFAKSVPVRSTSEISFDLEEVKSYTLAQSKSLLQKVQTSWVIQNNLHIVENMVSTSAHLRALWENDRTTFAEEFWNFLKKNTGASFLQIFYHDIELGQSENQKNKLVISTVGRSQENTPQPASESEIEIFKEIVKPSDTIFNIVEYNAEDSKLVILSYVDEGPILIMASVSELGPLQKSVLAGLINGLQSSSGISKRNTPTK